MVASRTVATRPNQASDHRRDLLQVAIYRRSMQGCSTMEWLVHLWPPALVPSLAQLQCHLPCRRLARRMEFPKISVHSYRLRCKLTCSTRRWAIHSTCLELDLRDPDHTIPVHLQLRRARDSSCSLLHLHPALLWDTSSLHNRRTCQG